MADGPGFTERGLAIHIDAPPGARPGDEAEAVLNRLARLVGLTAIFLPVVLAAGTVIAEGCFRLSISHFYHTQFLGAVFVGLLFFIGAFMVAYTGHTWLERAGSTIAGLCAFGVALFPVAGPGCADRDVFLSRAFVRVSEGPDGVSYTLSEAGIYGQDYFALFGSVSEYHLAFAGGVFVYLGLFCLVVLRRVIPAHHGTGAAMIHTKRRRNRLYFWCGTVILGCVAVLALRGDPAWWDAWHLTFWVEATALWAFGVAWLAKGRLFAALNDGR